MKWLKYIFLILLIVIIGSCTYVAVQPNNYDISRSRIINAPVSVIYNNVIDLKNWEAWSPWVEKDSSLQFTYPEQTKGVGGSNSWTGKDGLGSMKTIAANEVDSITQELQFGDMPPSTVYWKLNKADQGTEVVWGMKANNMNFIQKAFVLYYGGMDKMVGPDYERGLEKLDDIIVESMNKFEVIINGITEYGGGFYLYKTTNATTSNISSTMGMQYGSIGMYMGQNQIESSGMPLTIYHDMNTENGSVIMSNGIPVKEKIIITDDSDILCGYMPKMKVLKATLKGNYTNLGTAWGNAMKHIADNNLVQAEEKPFEIYTTDPGNYPNPADWITEIYIPIAE